MLSGSSPSVVRAVIMGSLMIASKLVYRRSDSLNNIVVACTIILLLNPYYVLNLGFQLSFLGTLGIILFNNKITILFDSLVNVVKRCLKIDNKIESCYLEKKFWGKFSLKLLKKVKMILIVSISANLLIIPILIYNFNSFGLIFLISNILITPILGVMSFTGYITCFFSLFSIKFASIIAISFEFCINVFIKIAECCSYIDFARFVVPTLDIIIILAYYVFIIYMFYFYGRKNNKIFFKVIALVIVIVIIVNCIIPNISGFKLYFIDVGQGDCTLIVTSNNKKILIDGGGSESSSYDVGEKILVPYLLDRKITKIDYMIFSHFDSDHCKGLFTVMEKLKVKNVIISEQGEISENYIYFLKLVQEKQINVVTVQARK